MSLWDNVAVCNTLREMHAKGYSASWIAAELKHTYRENVTRNAVIGKLTRLGLTGGGGMPKPRWPKEPRPEKPKRIRPRYTYRNGHQVELVPKIPKAETPDLPANISHCAVSFVDLRASQCRWILGDAAGEKTLFCGAPKHDGFSYCARHCRSAFRDPLRSQFVTQEASNGAWRCNPGDAAAVDESPATESSGEQAG